MRPTFTACGGGLLVALALATCGPPAPPRSGPAILALSLRDEAGQPVSGQISLTRDGAPLDPAVLRGGTGWRVRRQDFAAGAGERYVLVTGDVELALPPGDVSLRVTRGQAYAAASQRLRLRAGERRSLRVNLLRWTDRRARGWACGDLHLHLARLDPARDAPIRALLEAVDLDVAGLVDWAGRTEGMSPGWGGWAWTEAHLAERPSGRPLLLNGQGWGRPDRACVLALFGHRTPARGASRHSAAAIVETAVAEGGLASGTMGDVPLDSALAGRVAATEVLSHGRMDALERWYALLSAGAHIAAVAGSDTQGPPWPDTLVDYHAPPGASRVCARVEGALTQESFLDAIRGGRTFVTSGPTLELTVDGQLPGATLEGSGPRHARVRLTAPLPPRGALELVVDGEVVASARADHAALSLDREVSFNASGWVAARLRGEARMPLGDRMVAHTSAVYVTVDGARANVGDARARLRSELPDRDAILSSGRSTAHEREVALRTLAEAHAQLGPAGDGVLEGAAAATPPPAAPPIRASTPAR